MGGREKGPAGGKGWAGVGRAVRGRGPVPFPRAPSSPPWRAPGAERTGLDPGSDLLPARDSRGHQGARRR